MSKRFLFMLLVAGFGVQSWLVYTAGTEQDAGSAWRNASASRGKLLYQKFNCTACHQLYGLGGYMGPDLTNVISASGKGSLYAKAFLSGGTQRMPDFHLSETEIEDLIAFLTYVDRTGISPVTTFTLQPDGTVHLP